MQKQPKLKASRMLSRQATKCKKLAKYTMIYHKIQHEIPSIWFITTYRQKHYDLGERIEWLGKICHDDITLEK